MNRYLGIVNYLSDISQSDYIEKAYDNLKNKFNINQKLDLFKTSHINLSNGFLNKSFGTDKYVIMYNGHIYNIKEIKKDLTAKGYRFSTKTNLKKEKIVPIQNIDKYLEAEILLTSYHEYKEKFLEHLNGAFSICIYDKTNNIVFLSRDRLGIKPLYYTNNKENKSFIFSTNIKDILNVPTMKATLDKQGILELIGMGPFHTPGLTYFKDIYEILPGHYAIYSNIGLTTHKYWELNKKKCLQNESDCIKTLQSLLKDSIKTKIIDIEKIGILSPKSINSGIAISYIHNTTPNIHTFSYNNYISDSKEKIKDSNYIKFIKRTFGVCNYNIISDTKVLHSLLIPSMMARDMPGMAYDDSTMLEFYSAIKNNGLDKCMSNLYCNEMNNTNPIFFSQDIRNQIINKKILNNNLLEEYISLKYDEFVKDVIYLTNDDEKNKKQKYLNIKWHLYSQIERINYISSNIDLEVFLPFIDYRIIEYIYNLPDNIDENYIFEKIYDKYFPNVKISTNNSQINHDKIYINTLEHELKKILNDSESKLLKIVDKNYILKIINSKETDLNIKTMNNNLSYIQILTYLIQIEYWINIYDIEIEL
ncbi:MAG: hypothetical protein K0R72_71 [Clostridia bacterium]|nr:hypothetical protein [Clostridia bacterium]